MASTNVAPPARTRGGGSHGDRGACFSGEPLRACVSWLNVCPMVSALPF
jgi:hypothetical protein